MNYQQIEERLGYIFKDKKLLKTALTLASADANDNNETMEFFGDAILEFLVSEKIYDEKSSEGELTERRKMFVSDKALTPISQKLSLDKFLIKSHSDTLNKKAVPSAYEAVLAAIYIDGGMDEARAFFNRTMDFKPIQPQINYKGKLHELLQGKGLPLPVYEHVDVGTPQTPKFRSRVQISGNIYEGEAESVRQADQLAAMQALNSIIKR